MLHVKPEATLRRRRDHIKDKNGAHAVIAEALPKLCEEEWGKAFWVTDKGGVAYGCGFEFGDHLRGNITTKAPRHKGILICVFAPLWFSNNPFRAADIYHPQLKAHSPELQPHFRIRDLL